MAQGCFMLFWINPRSSTPQNSSYKATYISSHKMLEEKACWGLHKDAACYFEKILEIAPHKTAFVQSLIFHLANHSSQMNKTYWKSKDELISNSFLWDPTQNPQCWLTGKNLLSSALCRHWMLSRRLTESNSWKGQMARESQGNPCSQQALMMMIMMKNFYIKMVLTAEEVVIRWSKILRRKRTWNFYPDEFLYFFQIFSCNLSI